MIVHDAAVCTLCGLCAEICHEGCLSVEGGRWRIERSLCSTCAQCIAICPQRALSWDGVPPEPFASDRLPTPEALDELLKQRRTMRFFAGRPLERALVEEIVSYGVHAPTNHYGLRAIVTDDPAVMAELEEEVLRFVRRIYGLIFRPKPIVWLLRRLKGILPLIPDDKDKVKMEHTLAVGGDVVKPAATVFLVGDRRVALGLESASYALYNMILYAQAHGIGSRLRGTGGIVLDKSRVARRRLGLGRHERIFGELELGYPAVRFRNKVRGKALPVTWVREER
ncbi:MAG: nitroreductase family protein [Anaerolineae bacterium]|nr:nitroreductase family protein [Anaerolineae bacterium]